MPRVLTVSILFLLVSYSAISQTYSFKRYSSGDGLEPTALNTVFQDSRGYMWFGGIGGACRYDGYRFVPYVSRGRDRSVVTRFGEDRTGTVWIATEGNGIAKVHPESGTIDWMTTKGGILPSDSVYDLLADTNGDMWLGTRSGLLILHSDGTTARLNADSGLLGTWVRAIGRDGENGIWVSTPSGVTRFSVADGKIKSQERFPYRTILCFARRRDGSLVFGTNEGKDNDQRGVFSYSHGTIRRLLHYDSFVESPKTQSIMEDSRGVLWIATTRGCILLGPTGMTRIRIPQGMINETISEVREDREGSIWVATGNGAMKLSRKFMASYTEVQGLSSSNLLTVMSDRSGNVWFGGFSGLFKIGSNGSAQAVQRIPPMANRQILALAQDRSGIVWVGTSTGLVKYDGRRFSQMLLSPDPVFPYVTALTADQEGGIWMSTQGKILRVRERGVVKSFWKADGLPYEIFSLLLDSKERLWFGTDGEGVGYIARDRVARFSAADGLADLTSQVLGEDSLGRIWFSSGAGVSYWQEGVFHPFEGWDVRGEDSRVVSFLAAKNGHIWFGTWHGVYEWSDTMLAHYDTRDGLAADIVLAISQDSLGNIWFGTSAGLTKFERSELSYPTPIPPLVIERISGEIVGRVLPRSSQLPFEERTVTFQLTSLSFFDEHNMEFQYRLAGLEEQWNEPTRLRITRYTTLPAGTYVMQARARNRNGAWTSPSSYAFEILPPFWATVWFRLGVVIIIGTVLYSLYRYRLSKLLELERLRLRIASDLHDEIGSSLGSIALESEMIQRKSRVSGDVKQRLKRIGDQSRRTAEAMRDIVWVINPEHDSLVTLMGKMREVAAQLLAGTSYTITTPSKVNQQALNLDLKRNLFLIYKETLHNILKHAHAKHVVINIEKTHEKVTLTVRDNGVGFDERTIKAGNGLRNIRSRAERMGATLDLRSEPGKGTKVELSVNIP